MSADENSSSFTIGNFAQEKGLPYVPKCYVVSPSNRSSLDLVPEKAQVPTIDIEVRKLALEIMGTIRESLGIVPNQLGKKMEDGVQVMAALKSWTLRMASGRLSQCFILVGDHFEVLSNGLYKSVMHRAILNCERTRISTASLHSLGMDDKMGTAKELVDEKRPKGYKESSFRDFLDFIATTDIGDGKSFIGTLKLEN
ncbi:hypothetical protein POUND7_005494 [Theobroma cacao]